MVGGWYDFIRKITVVKYGNDILYVDIVYVRLPFSFPLPLFPLVLSGEDWLGNLAVSPHDAVQLLAWGKERQCGQYDDTQE